MAYVYRKTATDKGQGAGAGDQQGSSQNLVSDTQSAAISPGGGGSGGAPGDAPGGGSGSGWTNLQSYVGANEGAAERGAERIVGDVSEQRGQTQEAIEDFGNTELAGYDQADDTFLEDLRQGKSGSGKTLDNVYGQTWEGPANAAGAEGFDDVYTQVDDFGRTSDVLSDPNKITEEYTPGANIGEKSLDRFFFQQKPAQEIFQQEVEAGDALEGLWDTTYQGLDDRITAGKEGMASQDQAIEEAFGQGLSTLEGGFDPAKNQAFLDAENAKRRAEFDAFMSGEGRGGRVGDNLSGLGDQVGYDWNDMFKYSGDTGLGDYGVDAKQVQDYRNFLNDYGGTFGASDMFGGADITTSGTRYHNPVGTGDAGQKSALAELGGLWNQGAGGYDTGRWNELLSTLGVEGYSDPRALPPPPPPAPAPPPPPEAIEGVTPGEASQDPTEAFIENIFGENAQEKLLPKNW